GHEAEAAIDADGRNSGVDGIGPRAADAQEVLPQPSPDALSVHVGPDKQVVQMRFVPSGDVAAEVRTTLRDPVRIGRRGESLCDGSLLETFEKLHGLRSGVSRNYQWRHGLQQPADCLNV